MSDGRCQKSWHGVPCRYNRQADGCIAVSDLKADPRPSREDLESQLALAREGLEKIAEQGCWIGSGDEGEMVGEENCEHCIAQATLAKLAETK